jgi:hypothetical protein
VTAIQLGDKMWKIDFYWSFYFITPTATTITTMTAIVETIIILAVFVGLMVYLGRKLD